MSVMHTIFTSVFTFAFALLAPATVRAQYRLLPSPVKLTRPAEVDVIVRQPDGRFLVAGDFQLLDDFPRNGIARLDANGRIDATFMLTYQRFPNFAAMAAAPDGSIYVAGGFFITIEGETRRSLMKLGPDGALDKTWNPDPDSSVLGLHVDAQGNVYTTGNFTRIGGASRNRIAKLAGTGTGTADPSWNPGASGTARAIVAAGGALFVGGSFSQLGGMPRQGLGKIDLATGAVDAAWNPNAAAQALAIASDGQLLVGGTFTTIGGLTRPNLAKVSTTGTGAADPAFNAQPSSEVSAIAVAADGAIYIGGFFQNVGGTPRVRLARLTSTGALDTSWTGGVANTLSTGSVKTNALASAGNDVVVGGEFDTVGGLRAFSLARVTPAGTLAPGFTTLAQRTGYLRAIASDPVTGDVYLGGNFDVADDAHARRNLVKLARLPDGPPLDDGMPPDPRWMLDTTWRVDVTGPGVIGFESITGTVNSLAVAGDGLFVGGLFNTVEGQQRFALAKIRIPRSSLRAGAKQIVLLDPWNADLTNGAALGGNAFHVDYTQFLDPDGITVAGGFSHVKGMPIANAARIGIAGTGTVDATFAPNPDQIARAIARTPSSFARAVVGGPFTSPHFYVVKGYDAGTSPAFFAPPSAPVLDLAARANLVVFAGQFAQVASQSAIGVYVMDVSTSPAQLTTTLFGGQLFQSPAAVGIDGRIGLVPYEDASFTANGQNIYAFAVEARQPQNYTTLPTVAHSLDGPTRRIRVIDDDDEQIVLAFAGEFTRFRINSRVAEKVTQFDPPRTGVAFAISQQKLFATDFEPFIELPCGDDDVRRAGASAKDAAVCQTTNEQFVPRCDIAVSPTGGAIQPPTTFPPFKVTAVASDLSSVGGICRVKYLGYEQVPKGSFVPAPTCTANAPANTVEVNCNPVPNVNEAAPPNRALAFDFECTCTGLKPLARNAVRVNYLFP